MKTVFSFKDKYASYELGIENRIICAQIVGPIGVSISNRYNHEFSLLIEELGSQPWGHYADFRQCEALTNEAKQKSVEMHEYARKNGCVVSAFQMNSALLVSQFNNIRKKNSLDEPVNLSIFDTKDECIKFIEDYIKNNT